MPSNITSPSYAVNNNSNTDVFFTNFFKKKYDISPNANDAIVSFFENYTGSKTAGAALAAAVIYTSLSQQIEPMSVLDKFKKLSRGELNTYLAMYLNLSRVGSSLLGVTNVPAANKYVERTIIA